MAKELMPWEQAALPATEEDLAIAAQLDQALGNLGASIAQAGGVASGLPYLGLSKTGFWKYGRDQQEVQPGSVWAIDVREFKHGSVAWEEGKAVKVMASIIEPEPTNLPPGRPWQPNFSFEIMCLTGEDAGTKCLYETSSYGGRAAMDELRAAIKRQALKKDGRVFPVVELLTRGYVNSYGPQTNPIFQIRGWIGAREMASMGTAEPVAAVEAKPEPTPEPVAVPKRGPGRPPANGAAKAAAAVAEVVPASPVPASNRRRRAVGETA